MNSQSLLIFLMVMAAVGIQEIHFHRILGLFTHIGGSHFHTFYPIMNGLAEQGHDVTVLSYFKAKRPSDNYKEIIFEGLPIINSSIPLGVSHFFLLNSQTFIIFLLLCYILSNLISSFFTLQFSLLHHDRSVRCTVNSSNCTISAISHVMIRSSLTHWQRCFTVTLSLPLIWSSPNCLIPTVC